MNMNEDSRKIPTEKQGDARQLTDEQLDAVAGGLMVAPVDKFGAKIFRCRSCGTSIETIYPSPQNRCSCGKIDWEFADWA